MKNVLQSTTVWGILTAVLGTFGVPAVDPSLTTTQIVLQIVGFLLALWGRWKKGDLTVGKAAPIILALLALTGCAGLGPTAGPASAGAPQPATNLAQTARDQAAVPGQAYGGHVQWYFASQGAAEIQKTILALAQEQKWTPEQLSAALASTNGAPQSVTINTENVQGGDADNAGAGNGGAGSANGGGSVNRP